jgi:hypothetical protein
MEENLYEDRPSRIKVLQSKLEISERLLKEYRKENAKLKSRNDYLEQVLQCFSGSNK